MRATRGAAVLSACALAVALCGGTGAGAATGGGGAAAAGTATLQAASATQQVTTAFVTLFNANDKNLAAREKLIQNASKYKAKFLKLFQSKVAKANPTVAKVTAVSFPSAATCTAAVKSTVCAMVTYDIDTATTGASLLPNQTGYAVRVSGHWLVADVTFCALARLAGASC